MTPGSVSVIVACILTLTLISVASYNYLSTNVGIVDATTTNTTTPTLSSSQQRDPVSVMYAASLFKTFEETLGPAFQEETGYPYQGEPRGSVQVANMILDGLRRPDVFVSAGTIPIQKLMNATNPLADWLVKFGSAEMVIAYSPNSRFFNDLEKARAGELPWYEVLSKPGLKFGRTDPELDPKGLHDNLG